MPKQEVITPTEPIIGVTGMAEVPDSISYNKRLIHTPEILPEDLSKMMKIDGEISGLFRILSTPLRGAELEVMSPHSRANRETNFITEVLTAPYADGGMTIPLQTVMATIMRMLIDGWSPHEIVWEIKNQEVRVEKIEYRPVHSIEPQVDSRNNLSGYVQHLNRVRKDFDGISELNETADIDVSKIMHFVNAPEWNYIFGRSIFIQAFYHFEKKHKLYYISHIAAQINALRLRVLRLPAALEGEMDKYLEMVAKLGFNSTISLPEGAEIELLDVGDNFPDVMPLIQHHDTQAAKSVLAQVIDLGVEGRTGSFNLSDTHLDVFIVNLELMAKYVANVFNTVLIPKLIDWNFGTGNYPKVQFQPFDRLVKAQLFDIYKRMSASTTLNASPEFLTEIEKSVAKATGLNVPYDEIETTVTEMFRKKGEAQVKALTQTAGSESSSGTGDPDTRDRTTRD